MKDGYIKPKRKPYEERTESDFRWFSVRRYSRLGSSFECLLRRDLGERYWNLRVVGGTAIALFYHRIILYCGGKLPDVLSLGYGVGGYYFDYFIAIFLLVSVYHFISNMRSRGKGKVIYSYSMGESRLFFLARLLKVRRVRYVTFVLIEPLFVLCLSPFVLLYSPYLAVMTLLASGWLLHDNLKNMRINHTMDLDRLDSEIFAREALELKNGTGKHRPSAQPIIRAHEPKPQPKPMVHSQPVVPSVQEVLRKRREEADTIS